jgi:hypothetical protein
MIRELAKQGDISWTKHSKERMLERGVAMPEIINSLLKGKVTELPFYSHTNGGGYETSVEKGTAGAWLKVVVCVKLVRKFLVITVIK